MELCEQRRAFLAQTGHSLVLGGPGCGKTTLALLKAHELCSSLQPGQSVLFLSFSRAAVRQILDRSREVLSRSQRGRLEVRTYHRFCLDVLEAHGRLLTGKRPRFVTPADERLRQIDFGEDWDEEKRRLALESGEYCFDEFAGAAATLFQRCKSVRELFCASYPVVIVDEFQDTGHDQWRLVQSFASGSTIICLADPDQRIFEYRDDVDPKRVEEARDFLKPEEFNFAGENFRSPAGGILQFADAILRGDPIPEVDEVDTYQYRENIFGGIVSAAIASMFQILRDEGIESPSVAVLARSNSVVEDVSNVLFQEQSLRGSALPPIEHQVEWDADLTAAAARVVGSVLEWPVLGGRGGVEQTLDAISFYYQLKNAVGTRPTKSASVAAQRFSDAARAVSDGTRPRIKVARELLDVASGRMELEGAPVSDWKSARSVIDAAKSLEEIGRAVRLVRLFRATDALAAGLADLWRAGGNYRGANALIRRVLERERLVGAERTPTGCVVMSFHKSKGKEFDGVVIVERKYKGKLLSDREAPDYRPSRRVLRVAITRARNKVMLLRPVGAQPL